MFLDLGTLQLHCCLRRVRDLSDLIKNILICVPKIFEGLKVRLVCLVCSTRRLSSGLHQWQFARFNTFESVPENNSESEHVNVSAQTEGCLNVTWSFPIILKRECFHNNTSRLKWLKLSTLLIFKMVSKCCFVYVSYIFVLVSSFERQIYTIDSCWYRQLIPLTHSQNAHVSSML